MEARSLDGGDQLGGSDETRPVADGRPLARQIDCRLDSRQAIEHFLEPRRAGGAAHATD
ncbi:MAG: hypothetical protein AW07_03248 [Candidatus Accumulibacter sp. SK-11]|nr:MAG: hypothetical protein AW07_03248 [Candidatus Accumulibacter sp. SK-11]